MSASADRSLMRGQVIDLLQTEGWALPAQVIRPTKTKTAQGQFTDTDVEISPDELIWIQPASGDSAIIQAQLNDKTTHLAFQLYAGLPLKANDKIMQAGLQYDVINHFVYESHRLSELQLVVKL